MIAAGIKLNDETIEVSLNASTAIFSYVHHSIEIQKTDLALPLIFIYHSGVFFNDQCTFPT